MLATRQGIWSNFLLGLTVLNTSSLFANKQPNTQYLIKSILILICIRTSAE